MSHYARLIEASYVGEYTVSLRFSDGVQGHIDLSDQLWGAMFEPLKDKALFSQLRVDPEVPVLVWPNGADLSPEFIYERTKQAAQQ
jgi:hypothetical protein